VEIMVDPREAKFLRAILCRLDRPVRSVWFVRRRLALTWVGLVLLLTLVLAISPLLPRAIAAFLLVMVGAIGATAYFRISAIYGWSLLGPYINRGAMEARVRELGA